MQYGVVAPCNNTLGS